MPPDKTDAARRAGQRDSLGAKVAPYLATPTVAVSVEVERIVAPYPYRSWLKAWAISRTTRAVDIRADARSSKPAYTRASIVRTSDANGRDARDDRDGAYQDVLVSDAFAALFVVDAPAHQFHCSIAPELHAFAFVIDGSA